MCLALQMTVSSTKPKCQPLGPIPIHCNRHLFACSLISAVHHPCNLRASLAMVS